MDRFSKLTIGKLLRRMVALVVGCAVALTTINLSPVHAQQVSSEQCRNLALIELPDTTITVAEFVKAGEFAPPRPELVPPSRPPPNYGRLPAFCRVAATISPVPDSEIKFEVWMPADNWNSKFVNLKPTIVHFSNARQILRWSLGKMAKCY